MTEGKEGDWEIRYHENLAVKLEDIHNQMTKAGEQSPAGKLLKTIIRACERTVPQTGPGHDKFRLGGMLGEKYRRWKRVKLAGRFRLFFRYDSTQKIIVYAWINDEKSKRESGSPKDVYKVFEQLLDSRKIPNDIEELIKDSGPRNRI